MIQNVLLQKDIAKETAESTPRKRRLKLVWGPLCLTATLLGNALFAHASYKSREFEKLEKRYVEVLSNMDHGMCSPAASELEQWCQENYVNAQSITLGVMNEIRGIEYTEVRLACETARHSQSYYQEEIQRFSRQLDQNQALRQGIERKLFESEVEIGLEVQRKGENYALSYVEDNSDSVFHHYLELMRKDEALQDFFREIIWGEASFIAQYTERVEELMESHQPQSSLERKVQEDIVDMFVDGDAHSLLDAMAEHGLSLTKAEGVYHQQVLRLLQIKSTLQGLKVRYTQEQQLQYIDEMINASTVLLEESRQNEQDIRRQREELYRNNHDKLWSSLMVDLIDARILQLRTIEQIMDTSIIATGHTHPYRPEHQATTPGPSRSDQRASYDKPELVFQGFSDRWQVYSALCGQVALVREYPKTPPKPF